VNNTIRILIVVAAVVAVGLPVIGKLNAASRAQQAAANVAAGNERVSGPVQPGGTAAETAAPSAPPLLNAQNLLNTAWAMEASGVGTVTVELQANGVASASTGLLHITGTWSVSGASLTISTSVPVAKTFTCQISGDQVYLQGRPAKRLR
jgi:hypothetical protein